MTTVQYQSAAEADLIEIWIQIADDAGDKRADEYISRLMEVCQLLAGQPQMGVERLDVAEGIRSYPIDRYVIYYQQDASSVSVLRVWHTARDPKSLAIGT